MIYSDYPMDQMPKRSSWIQQLEKNLQQSYLQWNTYFAIVQLTLKEHKEEFVNRQKN